MTLTAWEHAAREFEPAGLDGQLWRKDSWSAALPDDDRLTLTGLGVDVTYHLPGIDLGKLR